MDADQAISELRRANEQRERIARALERIADAFDPPADDLPEFRGPFRIPRRVVPVPAHSADRLAPPGDDDDRLIEELDLRVRAYNCLKRGGYQTVGEVRAASWWDLFAIPNFGKACLEEVRVCLERFDPAGG